MKFSEVENYILGSLIASVFAGFGWLVRRVLTNQQQIGMLQTDLRNREKQRDEDRELMRDIRTDQREMRQDIKRLFERGTD